LLIVCFDIGDKKIPEVEKSRSPRNQVVVLLEKMKPNKADKKKKMKKQTTFRPKPLPHNSDKDAEGDVDEDLKAKEKPKNREK
jgi:hypothetical protein